MRTNVQQCSFRTGAKGFSMRSHLLVALAASFAAINCSSSQQGAGNVGVDAGPVAGADAGSSGGTDGGGGGGGGSVDAGSGGGTASDCDGVVPAQSGTSFTFDVPVESSAPESCDSATADESGNVAVGYGPGGNPPEERIWHLYDSNGAHQARFSAFDLFPQGPGYEGLFAGSGAPQAVIAAYWTPDGKRTTGPVVGGDSTPGAFRAWPNGMLTATLRCGYLPPVTGTYTLHRFDASLNEVAHGTASFACVPVAGAVAEANGNWLLVVSGPATTENGFAADDLVGYWFDSQGKALTGWFRIGPGGGKGHAYLIHALIGGGAAVRIDGVWTYFIPSGKAEAQPAPDFLVENPQTDFTLVRGAKAYAILPRTGDTTGMKLYSASGNLCGQLKFPTGGLTTGADGSVISSSGNAGCTTTVWPGLLK